MVVSLSLARGALVVNIALLDITPATCGIVTTSKESHLKEMTS